MYALAELIPMLRRDLADKDATLDASFLEGKLADSSAELILYISSLSLSTSGSSWYLSEEPSYPLKRLISLNAAIDFMTSEFSTLKKTSERIDEPGLSWSISVASNVVRISLTDLISKRDRILQELVEKSEFYPSYLNLIEALKEKDDLAVS